MRIRTLLAASLAFLILAATVQSADPAPVTLRYQYKMGEMVPYTLELDQKLMTSLGGTDIEAKVHTVFDLTMTTLEVDSKGTAKVKITVRHVKMTLDGPTGMFTLDSDDKTEPEDAIAKTLAPYIKGLSNLEMTATVSPTGETKNAAFSDETLKKLSIPRGAARTFGGLITPDSLKSALSAPVLPREAVEKGKTWTQPVDEKIGVGRLTGQAKYTYDGEIDKGERKVSRILKVQDVKVEPSGAPGKMKVKDTTGKGTILFDNQAGRVVESTSEMKMQVEIELGGVMLSQDIMQTSTLRLKETPKGK